jgi:enoyl-CoA hydratase/carnithine racemase
MSDIQIRTEGHAGRITLTRTQALNALTYAMMRAIDAALKTWASDASVRLVLIDAEGTRAFCAGGDIAEMHRTASAGDYDYGRRFWREEYRMNARIANYPKPVVTLMQGFTMGGGVGLGCHASHRVVGDTSRVAMPECGIGFVPDVGGSMLLARAPGRIGEYLGLTAARMGPGDAIHAGFADCYLPEADWPAVTRALVETGGVATVTEAARPAPPAPLKDAQAEIDRLFAGPRLGDVHAALSASDSDLAAEARKMMARAAPLSLAVALAMIRRLRGPDLRIETALELEYRVAHRIAEHGDFIEGIRAAIIDKDRQPRWQFADGAVPDAAVENMLRPLGGDALDLREDG